MNTIHSLDEQFLIKNSFGKEMIFSAELLAWNSFWLILLTIASLMVLINRLRLENCKYNYLLKFLFGGLALVSISGLLYPLEAGLIGVNIMVTIILVVDFFMYNKKKIK